MGCRPGSRVAVEAAPQDSAWLGQEGYADNLPRLIMIMIDSEPREEAPCQPLAEELDAPPNVMGTPASEQHLGHRLRIAHRENGRRVALNRK